MMEQFAALMKNPTYENYLAVRQLIVAHQDYDPYSTEMKSVENLIEQKQFDLAQKTLAGSTPNHLLNPGMHRFLSMLASQRGDKQTADMEKYSYQSCCEAILSTGNGSKDYPWLVTLISDEYDIMLYLGKQVTQQSIHEHNGRHLDLLMLNDGTGAWFDVTDAYRTQINAATKPQKPVSDPLELKAWKKKREGKFPYWVLHDYGMGGLWGIIDARSKAEIEKQYPFLDIGMEAPEWMTAEEKQEYLEEGPHNKNRWNIDDPPTGWLKDVSLEKATQDPVGWWFVPSGLLGLLACIAGPWLALFLLNPWYAIGAAVISIPLFIFMPALALSQAIPFFQLIFALNFIAAIMLSIIRLCANM